ncbi:hypothetical protein [Kribbella deserti]|uniref:Uncharacterized protein n=1 Tax=Kribbella deserti TaxID=1926257 RepID=A0ABV6QUN0_9ACTN
MDEVKKLLEQFADQAVAAAPPVDVDADVARGRRALRRIKTRRRATGVLCLAAASAVALMVNESVGGWDRGDAGVAADAQSGQATPGASTSDAPNRAMSTESATTMFGAAGVDLVTNKQAWPGLGCDLVPAGWTVEQPANAERVVLAPSSERTSSSSSTATKLVLSVSDQAESLKGVRVVQTGGRTFHLGTYPNGRQIGQVLQGDRWVVAQVPVGGGWSDDVLQRLLASCKPG